MEREVLYWGLHQLYVDVKVKTVLKKSKLRVQAVPNPVPAPQLEPAQVALSVKVKRDRVVVELKRKIQILQDKAEASVVLEYLARSLELETLCAEVRSLLRSTEEMSEKIKTIDPTTRGEVDTRQAATDAEVSSMMYPLELKVAQLVTLCRGKEG